MEILNNGAMMEQGREPDLNLLCVKEVMGVTSHCVDYKIYSCQSHEIIMVDNLVTSQ